MNKTIHHIGLFSRDPEKLVEFYTDQLDFERLGTKTISKDWMTRIFDLPAECQLIKLQSGPLILEIFSCPESELNGRGNRAIGYNHWGMGVEEKKSFVQELEGKGVPVLKLKGKDHFIYFIKDPEGNLIEIYQG